MPKSSEADRPNPRHHPLPGDDRARHDRLPEGVEDIRDKGDDAPGQPPPSTSEPPAHHYRYPDGTPYDS
jgi:hypothetical protein